MSLGERFRQHLLSFRLPPGPAIIAVSGGTDSLALLDLVCTSRDAHGLEPVVAHVDHGIHPESAAVAARVRAAAERYGVPFESVRIELGGGASESVARAARYAALGEIAERYGAVALLTAHHADDQVETVLMRLLAGSGPAGLAGMSARRGRLVRPLLPFRREELARYVLSRGLTPWDDPANADPRHVRSWLRTIALPLLRARLPELDRQVLRAGAQAAADRAAWDALLDALPELACQEEPDGISVAALPLRGYDSYLASAIVRAAARRVGCTLGPVRARRVVELAWSGASGAVVPLGAGWQAELAFGRLRVVLTGAGGTTAAAVPAAAEIASDAGDVRWARWRIRWRLEPAPAEQPRRASSAWFEPGAMQVRAWQPGDRVRPLAGRGRRLVVRCFQDARVPRSQRDAWPVLAADDGILWVPGVCRSDQRVPRAGAEALRVDVDGS